MVKSDGRRASLRGMAVLAMAAVVGCAPGKPYEGPRFPFMPSYRAAHSGAPVLLSNAEWWHHFNDPVLDQLVALALKDNLSLAIARERVIESRAELRQVPGAAVLSPSVGLTADGTGSRGPDGSGEAKLGLSWMLDPYGAKREQLKAAGARTEAADAERDAAQLLMLYNVANAYVDLRYRQRVLHLRQQELDSRQQTLALTRKMLEANSATRLDITRSQARVAEIQSQLPELAAAITAKKNEIAVLSGAAPGALALDLDKGEGQPRPDLAPDMGIPADLLRNRPDIRIAERTYYAALSEIGVAQAKLYPSLSLTGAITLNALEGGRSGSEYFFGPTIAFPSLPTGSARAGVDARVSQAKQAHTAWKSTVLTSILEVENALLDYRAVTDSLQAANRAAKLYAEARDLTQEVFRREDATLGDLIDAEQAVSQSQDALAAARLRQGQSFVALNVRLGSGNRASLSAAPAP